MRFPLSLTTTMVGYITKKKLTRAKRFPLVLMLEPLHACNLTCTGCGRKARRVGVGRSASRRCCCSATSSSTTPSATRRRSPPRTSKATS